MMNRTLTAAALATVLAVPAFAQSTAPSATTPPPASSTSSMPSATTTGGTSFIQGQQATDWRGSKLIGATVYGSDNSSIGEISDLVLSSDGKVNGVVIGVGGFLGVGEKNVAVPFEKLNVTRKAGSAAIDKITVSFTKDELKNAPTYAFYESAKSSTTGSAAGERKSPLSPAGSTKSPTGTMNAPQK